MFTNSGKIEYTLMPLQTIEHLSSITGVCDDLLRQFVDMRKKGVKIRN